MSKKLRVLVLSVIAVLFAVSSAFAITADDLGSLITESDDNAATTEGYNYRHKIFIDTTDPSTDIKSVSWEVYPSGDISWLTWTISSLDVVFEGVLPAFVSSDDAAANTYIVHVVAYTSGDIDDNEPPTQGTISADFNETGLGITVEKEATTVSEFPDMVSIDIASTDRGLYKVTDIYSVLINFPTTTGVTITDSEDDDGVVSGEYVIASSDVFVNAQLEYTSSDIATFEENLNLPSWLKYEVVDTQYAGSYTESDDGTLVYEEDTGTVYVKTLRIFYSADTKPSSNAAGSVRVIVSPASTASITDESSTSSTSDDRTTQTFADKHGDTATIGWSVNYYAIPAVSFDLASYDITVKYGTSTDIGVSGDTPIYFYKQVPVSITFSPDISADVAITASWDVISSDTDNAYGKITLNVEPLTPLIKTYSTDMIVTDSYDNTAAITLYINVSMDAMYISADVASASVTVDAGKSENVTFTAYNFNGKVISWDIGTIPSGITVTSSDSGDYGETLTLTIVGQASGDYSFDVSAMDSFDRTASTTMYVTVLSPDLPPAPPAPGVSFSITPASTAVTVAAGASRDVSFTASNNSGNVTWSLGTVPSGVTVAPSSSAYATQGNTTMVYTVTGVTSGDYTVTVTATDSAGRTSNATMSITVTDTALSISASPSSVEVTEESSTNVTLRATGNSGRVTWTAGTPTGGFRIAPATDMSYATQNMTTMVYTVTGVTAGSSSSFTVTATDAAGNTDSATISVTVTPKGGGETGGIDPKPRIDVTSGTIQSTIRQALFAKMGSVVSGLGISELPDTAMSSTAVKRVGTTAVYLPAITVTETKIYVFGVSLDNLPVNYILGWDANVSSSSTGERLEASAEEEDAVFIKDDGEETTTVPSSKHVNVAAYFEAGKTYEPIITAADPSASIETGVGSSSGGCSAGLGAIVSALAAAFFISKKRS